ncbi:MAG: hypothetical protein ACI8Z1_002822 [Candidatus Azotimanducaceae bacterium]|jgi:hypothetical protein
MNLLKEKVEKKNVQKVNVKKEKKLTACVQRVKPPEKTARS